MGGVALATTRWSQPSVNSSPPSVSTSAYFIIPRSSSSALAAATKSKLPKPAGRKAVWLLCEAHNEHSYFVGSTEFVRWLHWRPHSRANRRRLRCRLRRERERVERRRRTTSWPAVLTAAHLRAASALVATAAHPCSSYVISRFIHSLSPSKSHSSALSHFGASPHRRIGIRTSPSISGRRHHCSSRY